MDTKIELKINSLAPLGDGIGTYKNKFVYVKGAIPGDFVSISIEKTDKRNMWATLKNIKQKSPFRVLPKCSHYDKCGGCSLQHAHIDLQRKTKKESLERLFNQSDIPFIPCTNEYRYRRLARLQVRQNKRGRTILGFYAPKGHHVIDINECPVLDERLSAVLPILKTELLKDVKSGEIRLSTGDDGIYMHLVTDQHLPPAFYSSLQNSPHFKGVSLETDGIYSLVSGQETVHLTALKNAPPMELPLGSFGQANAEINEHLILQVKRWIEASQTDNCIELYGGAGNFAYHFAKQLKKTCLIELDKQACQVARKNFTAINSKQVSIVQSDATEGYEKYGSKYDVVLLDPPRTGANELAKKLKLGNHHTIIYVSCNPKSFKRDFSHLSDTYTIEEIIGYDMFPQTSHMEIAALLKKK